MKWLRRFWHFGPRAVIEALLVAVIFALVWAMGLCGCLEWHWRWFR